MKQNKKCWKHRVGQAVPVEIEPESMVHVKDFISEFRKGENKFVLSCRKFGAGSVVEIWLISNDRAHAGILIMLQRQSWASSD